MRIPACPGCSGVGDPVAGTARPGGEVRTTVRRPPPRATGAASQPGITPWPSAPAPTPSPRTPGQPGPGDVDRRQHAGARDAPRGTGRHLRVGEGKERLPRRQRTNHPPQDPGRRGPPGRGPGRCGHRVEQARRSNVLRGAPRPDSRVRAVLLHQVPLLRRQDGQAGERPRAAHTRPCPARRLRSLAQAVGRETGHDPDGSIAAWLWRDQDWSPHRYKIYLSFLHAAAHQAAATDGWPSDASPDLLEYALFNAAWTSCLARRDHPRPPERPRAGVGGDHPRGCGEQFVHFGRASHTSGPSPRARGWSPQRGVVACACCVLPAPAGMVPRGSCRVLPAPAGMVPAARSRRGSAAGAPRAVVDDAPGPVRAKQVVPRIGLPVGNGKIEVTRSNLKRLVVRGWLDETTPGLFTPSRTRKTHSSTPLKEGLFLLDS